MPGNYCRRNFPSANYGYNNNFYGSNNYGFGNGFNRRFVNPYGFGGGFCGGFGCNFIWPLLFLFLI